MNPRSLPSHRAATLQRCLVMLLSMNTQQQPRTQTGWATYFKVSRSTIKRDFALMRSIGARLYYTQGVGWEMEGTVEQIVQSQTPA